MRRPRVLVFSSLLPLPIDRGDRNRLFHVLGLLAEVAHVRLLAIERAWEPQTPDLSSLRDIEVVRLALTKREVIAQGLLSVASGRPFLMTRYALPRVIRSAAAQMREFGADTFWGYQAASFPLLKSARGLRRVVDVVDSPSRFFEVMRGSHAVSWAARAAMRVQWRARTFERRAIEESDIVLVNSSADARHVRHLGGGADKVIVFDNCVPLKLMARAWQPDPARPPRLLFVGNLAYPPNEAAVRQLATEILPRVRTRVPSAELLVAGVRGKALEHECRGRPGVRFLGFVEDLPSLYRDAAAMVIPVPLVGGTQYKLLEALAVGLPVVTTQVSAEIAGAEHGRHLLVAEGAAAFADATLVLLQDGALSRFLSGNGRALIESHYTWENKRALVRRILGLKSEP